MSNRIHLRQRFEHMGNHSGYDCLYQYLDNATNSFILSEKGKGLNLLQRIKNRLQKKEFIGSTECYNQQSEQDEKKLIKAIFKKKPTLVHINYIEDHYWLLSQKKIKKEIGDTKVVGTIHQPPSWWKINGKIELLSQLDALVVLDKVSKSFFEPYLPNKVFFIPHGIDTDFFKPIENKSFSPKRCVFSGHHLRDIPLLMRVIKAITYQRKDIFFDIVFPNVKQYPYQKELFHIASNANVKWHSEISDKALKKLYQQASLLLLPLIDCTANNALLEGMACGLPVITTDIEGIKSYTNESFTRYSPSFDGVAMEKSIESVIDDKELLQEMSQNARQYAIDNFSWTVVANSMKQLYQQLETNH